jgi:mannose/fructose/N-acetylgalactosamine-specific phosphotransferase system component IID
MEGPIINYLTPSTTSFSVVGVVVVGVVVDGVASVTTAVESTVVAVESVVVVVDAPPQAVNVAIATIANTFFIICFYLYLNIQPNSAIPKFRTLLLFQP